MWRNILAWIATEELPTLYLNDNMFKDIGTGADYVALALHSRKTTHAARDMLRNVNHGPAVGTSMKTLVRKSNETSGEEKISRSGNFDVHSGEELPLPVGIFSFSVRLKMNFPFTGL